MQVQSIQANQTTNNCRKPCFKAQFKQDAKGLFNTLWANATKDTGLELEIEKLAKKPNHSLELIDSHDIGVKNNCYYKVLNLFNGKVKEYNTAKYSLTNHYSLYSLIRQINEDEKLFDDDKNGKSDIFRLLTGQEKPKK